MNNIELTKYQESILDAVISKRLKDSFDLLNGLNVGFTVADIKEKYDSIYSTYQNMLKYSFDSVPDPQRDAIYIKLQQSILELADELKDKITRQNFIKEYQNYLPFFIDLNSFSLPDISQIINKLTTLSEKGSPTTSEETNVESSNLLHKIFYSLLLINIYKEPENELLMQVINNKEINWRIKSALVSAVTLSLMRHFDRNKFYILFDFSQIEEPETRQRALIGLFLGLLVYQKRLVLYKDIISRLSSIPDNSIFQKRFLAVLIQFIKSLDTEKITRKIQDEIVPEVLKIRSDIEERLNLNELLSKENFEEKNPEWEDFFKESPDVYQKLEQFSKMQVDGSDVFMGAFAMLKNFDFFKEMANWFLPFDAKNDDIGVSFAQLEEGFDKSAFLEALEQSNVLCNSDKYSFCFNIQHMPVQQRKMMIDLFNMELNAANEMLEDEQKLDPESKNKIINAQYFQDLYRFYKLNIHSKEFVDVFSFPFDVIDSEILRIVFENKKIFTNLAEFYFAIDQYAEALKLFGWLNSYEKSFELLEKMGFCYQKLGEYGKAIELYKQAELFDRNRLWLHKKLGYCYRKIGEFHKAIEQYDFVLKDEPNDLNNLAYIGQLYMDSEDFEQALKYYYQIEYEAPENSKAFRPIGWCSFILGKYDNALKYYQKVINNNPTAGDFLNIGHCYWIAGKMTNAVDAYRTAVDKSKYNEKWFRETFDHDRKFLTQKSIDDFEITLMIDYVLLK
jgi:tetratricopeptide (TPR) repeat protein